MSAISPVRLLGFGLMLAAGLTGCATGTIERHDRAPAAAGKLAQLRAALAHADRMTIAPQVTDGKAPAPVTLKTADVIAEFLDSLEIDEDYGPVRYDCESDAIFTFYEGERPVVVLNERRLDHFSWKDGPWTGDAVITLASYRRLQLWCRQSGADVTAVVRSLGEQEGRNNNEAARRFLANLAPTAQQIFTAADTVVYSGTQVRRISTPLASLYAKPGELATAAFRALAESPARWLEDDWAVAAVQSALLELDPLVVRAAMMALPDEDPGRRGAARYFFRFHLLADPTPADAGATAVRLADFTLRTGRDDDKHAVLEYVAGLPGEAAAALLRDIASGRRIYAFKTPYGRTGLGLEEPGLRYAAALWLAQRGDASARGLLASLATLHPFGPDEAALSLAAALLDPHAPLRPAIFKYRSRTLGMAGLEALHQREDGDLTVEALTAACDHLDREVARRAGALALRHGLQPAVGGQADLGTDIDPLLADLHPQLALTEYTQMMEHAEGRRLAALQNLRARTYVNLGDYDRAEIDYLNAASSPFPEAEEASKRLAWVQWYLGDFTAAEETIRDTLQADPDAELLLLRGIMRYSEDDFRPTTDADLTAATVLDPTEGYAPLFQHLTSLLGGRPEQSRLRAYFVTATGLPDWPATVIGCMLGAVTPTRLLQLAGTGDPGQILWHTCEANFYLSQVARAAGKADEELRYLTACAATNQPRVAEFWVAQFRLEKLRAANPSAAGRSRAGKI